MSDKKLQASLEQNDKSRWWIAVGGVCTYLLIALKGAWFAPFPNNYDELAHISYIQGCSTLSTEAPLEECVDTAESGGVAILIER